MDQLKPAAKIGAGIVLLGVLLLIITTDLFWVGIGLIVVGLVLMRIGTGPMLKPRKKKT